MNKKEIAEIKKQFIPNRTAVRKIAGCIIKEKKLSPPSKKICTFTPRRRLLPITLR